MTDDSSFIFIELRLSQRASEMHSSTFALKVKAKLQFRVIFILVELRL